jgi:predicted nicotinamide N-methyase
VLAPSSLVLELGSGISALVGLLLAPRVARYVLTDQAYVAKLVEQNLAENRPRSAAPASAKTTTTASSRRSRASTPAGRREAAAAAGDGAAASKLHFTPLDWETDEVTPSLTGPGSEARSFDVVLACDCIYNEALVEPFVATCVDVCRLRAAEAEADTEARPTVCVVAQHLRDPLVFEAWATRFTASFHTWRVPDAMLVAGLRSNSGFVVHVGVLRGGGINLEAV